MRRLFKHARLNKKRECSNFSRKLGLGTLGARKPPCPGQWLRVPLHGWPCGCWCPVKVRCTSVASAALARAAKVHTSNAWGRRTQAASTPSSVEKNPSAPSRVTPAQGWGLAAARRGDTPYALQGGCWQHQVWLGSAACSHTQGLSAPVSVRLLRPVRTHVGRCATGCFEKARGCHVHSSGPSRPR
jgi:hypothetical protein